MDDQEQKQDILEQVLPPLHLRPRSKEELTYLSKRAQEYFVPDVSGIEKPAAVAHIEGAGLKIGAVKSMYHDTVRRGFAVTTTPPKGIKVTEGTAVDLILSYGPKNAPITPPVPRAQADPRVVLIPDPTMPVQYEIPVPGK